MKRNAALIPLSHDHQHGLAVAFELRSATPETTAEYRSAFLTFWHDEESRHFRIEEEVLLPAFARRASADHEEIARVLVEHVEIRARVAELDEGEVSAERLQELSEIVEAHIRHEERVLFPLIEETLPADDLATLGAAIEAAERAG